MLGVTHLKKKALRKWLLAAFSISNALHIYIASYSVAMLSYSSSMIQLGGIHNWQCLNNERMTMTRLDCKISIKSMLQNALFPKVVGLIQFKTFALTLAQTSLD